MDYTVHGILQARILEWVAFSFSRGSSHARYQTQSPTLQMDSLPADPQGKPKWFYEDLQNLLELIPKKDVLFVIGEWNGKVGSQELPEVTGKFGLEVQKKAD